MEQLLAALRAVAEPTRLRLVVLCARGELTVSELTQILGQSQPRVSRHLKLLCEAGLLDRFREGSWVFYRLSQRGPAGALARQLVAACDEADPTIALDLQRLGGVKRQRAELASAYFRENAAQWHRIRSLYVDEREVEAALVEIIAAADPRDLLDIGTGTGRMLEILAPRVERALGIDQSREMLSVARVNLERAGLENGIGPARRHVPAGPAGRLLRRGRDPPGAALRRPAGGGDRRGGAGVAAGRASWCSSISRRTRSNFCATSTPIAGSALPMPRWRNGAAPPGSTRRRRSSLPGDPLTVVIWTAQRGRRRVCVPRQAVRQGAPAALVEGELH